MSLDNNEEINNDHIKDRLKLFKIQSNVAVTKRLIFKSKTKIMQVLLFFIFICFTENGYSQYVKIDLQNISIEKKQTIHEFSYNTFTGCQNGIFPKLSVKNSTANFRKRFTKSKIINACNWHDERYGEIEKILLIEVLSDNDGNQIFRHKVKRTKADWYSEIRTTIDENNKFIGIITKIYWSDRFYKWNENPKLLKVDKTLLNDSIVRQNQEFALKSYNICEALEIYEVNESNAVYRSIRKGWKAEMLKECDSVKTKNGNFKNLKFEEFLTDSVSTKIYRYKVDFDLISKPSEIRIYSRFNDKYSGIFVVDVWYDKYFRLKEALEKSRNELGN